MFASTGYSQDGFGWAIVIQGDLALASAPFDHDHGNSSGAVYAYRRDARTDRWLQTQKLKASDAHSSDLFGMSLALKGDVLLVGAEQDSDAAVASGAVYVFHLDRARSRWVEVQQLYEPDPDLFANFGEAVALNSRGDVVAVAASGADRGDGAAYVFRLSGDRFVHEQKILPPDSWTGNDFGRDVAVEGDRVLIGAPQATPPGFPTFAGAAYVFRYDARSARQGGPAWVQHMPALLPIPGGGPFFGHSVTMSDGVAIVGAYGENSARGAVYITLTDPAPADFNCDGSVNGFDLAMLLAAWTGVSTYLPCPPIKPADLNGDCRVNGLDLAMLLSAWNP